MITRQLCDKTPAGSEGSSPVVSPLSSPHPPPLPGLPQRPVPGRGQPTTPRRGDGRCSPPSRPPGGSPRPAAPEPPRNLRSASGDAPSRRDRRHRAPRGQSRPTFFGKRRAPGQSQTAVLGGAREALATADAGARRHGDRDARASRRAFNDKSENPPYSSVDFYCFYQLF